MIAVVDQKAQALTLAAYCMRAALLGLFICLEILTPASLRADVSFPVFPVTGSFNDVLTQELARWGYTSERNQILPFLDQDAATLVSQVTCSNAEPPALPRDLPNHYLTFAMYILATRYQIEHNSADFAKASALFEKFRTCFSNYWKYQYPNPRGEPGSEFYLNSSGVVYPNVHCPDLHPECGIWDPWSKYGDNDSGKLAVVALTFDRIAQAYSPSQRQIALAFLRSALVTYMQETRVSLWNYSYFRPQALAIYGRILEDPKLVHLAGWLHSKMLHEEFSYDGMGSEGYSYGHQLAARIAQPIYCRFIDGYTDPVGYSHTPFEEPFDQSRFDNYNCNEKFGEISARINAAHYENGFPNLSWPVVHETAVYPYSTNESQASGPTLFGGFGHAILALGSDVNQTQVRFHFAATRSHNHHAAGQFMIFAQGEELVGGTGYDSAYDSQRVWNASTLNQNTVVINGQEQRSSGYQWRDNWPYIPSDSDHAEVNNSLENQDNFLAGSAQGNVHNNILFFDPGQSLNNQLQVIAVDLKDAYRGSADSYSRLLALRSLPGGGSGDSYILDLFRVKAAAGIAQKYQYLLHGRSYPTPYTLEFPGSSMISASGSMGRLQMRSSKAGSESIVSNFKYGTSSDSPALRTVLAGSVQDTVYRAQAPASVLNNSS